MKIPAKVKIRSWPLEFATAGLLFCFLSRIASADIGGAVDQPGWTWQAGAGWTDQSATTHDGVDAAQNNDGANAPISTTVTGPLAVNFWWKRPGTFFDRAECLVDGVPQLANAVSDGSWSSGTVGIPAGSHQIAWRCPTGPFWLDQVTTSSNTVPGAGAAVESPSLTFSYTGAGPWSVETSASAQTGSSFLTSPVLKVGDSFGDSSTLSTVITGPVMLGFWWQAVNYSSPAIRCEVDGHPVAAIGIGGPRSYGGISSDGWLQEKLYIPAGSHTVSWVSVSGSYNGDVNRLDNFTVVAAPSNPVGDAIGMSGKAFRMFGTGNWVADSSIVYGTGTSARSSGGAAALTLGLDGPGTLHFRMRFSDLGDYSYGACYLGGITYLGGESTVNGTWLEYTAVIPDGPQLVSWLNSSSRTGVYPTMWLDDVTFTASASPGACIEQNSLTVGGTWACDVVTTHDGVDALASPAVANGASASASIPVTGPALVQFWWKVSSEERCDMLTATIDGTAAAGISGEVGWTQRTVAVPAGAHTFAWRYGKDGSLTAGQDKGWIDQVVILPQSTYTPPATISPGEALDQPGWTWQAGDAWAGQAVFTHDGVDAMSTRASGSDTTLSTSVTGPVALSWWWRSSSVGGLALKIDGLEARAYGAADGKWESASVVIASGAHVVTWSGAGQLDQAATAVSPGVTVAEALDAPGRTFTTSGDGQWFGQSSSEAQAGGTLLRAPALAAGQSASVSTQVTGPATVSFWWIGSSFSQGAFSCLVDGKKLVVWGGGSGPYSYAGPFSGWNPEKVFIPAGSHTVTWLSQPESSFSLPDRLDNVSVTPAASNPVGDAIGLPNQALRTYGTDNWVADSSVVNGTGASARSSGAAAALGMVMDGPGTLHFRIRVTDLGDYSYAGFAVDSTTVFSVNSTTVFGPDPASGVWHEYNATIPAGSHRVNWYNSSSRTFTYPTMWLDDVYFSSTENLASAIEQDGAPVSGSWVRKTATTHDGFDALESPAVANGASAPVSFTLQGPATVHYWTRVSSEAGHDRLVVKLDNGGELLSRSGELGWQQDDAVVPAGEHTLTWTYTKDASGTAGQDRAWVDEVTVTPGTALSLSAWSSVWFSPAELANALVSGPDADPDGDGFSNLIEFGLGGNPRKGDAAQCLWASAFEGQDPVVRFARSPTADGIIVEARVSPDMQTWTMVPGSVQGSRGTQQVVEVPLTYPVRFVRVRVRTP